MSLNQLKQQHIFLRDMHRHFSGNWLLAIASYNTGAGNVGKAIDKANNLFTKPTYWDLNLPRETELYVPRLLALSKIIENPSRYGFKLPTIPNKRFTSTVSFRDPIDFKTLSIITGVSQRELTNLNPGYSTWFWIHHNKIPFYYQWRLPKFLIKDTIKYQDQYMKIKYIKLSKEIVSIKFHEFIM